MRITIAANDFGAGHAEGVVVIEFDGTFVYRLPKARPARAGFIFSGRGKKILATGSTGVHAMTFII